MTTTSSAPPLHRPGEAPRVGSGRAQAITSQVLLVCGILSALVYLVANVLCVTGWHGYDAASQTIDELSAIGAPTRACWMPLGVAHTVLLIAFGVGVLRCADRDRGLRVTAGLLIAVGALGPFWPPIHLRGMPGTLTDVLHVAFAGVVSILILLSIGFGATAFGSGFRRFSIAILAVLVVFGAVVFLDAPRYAAGRPTPGMGLCERIDLAAYLLWVVVLAVLLLRRPRFSPASSGASRRPGSTPGRRRGGA